MARPTPVASLAEPCSATVWQSDRCSIHTLFRVQEATTLAPPLNQDTGHLAESASLLAGVPTTSAATRVRVVVVGDH
jgi:hypothetical protein